MDKNTEKLVKFANKRMSLHCINIYFKDLKIIYKIFIRSILENSAIVSHRSLSETSTNAAVASLPYITHCRRGHWIKARCTKIPPNLSLLWQL